MVPKSVSFFICWEIIIVSTFLPTPSVWPPVNITAILTLYRQFLTMLKFKPMASHIRSLILTFKTTLFPVMSLLQGMCHIPLPAMQIQPCSHTLTQSRAYPPPPYSSIQAIHSGEQYQQQEMQVHTTQPELQLQPNNDRILVKKEQNVSFLSK